MANTTNFGWETPDDTDLVKDGAAAIRTLGSAIDTSLVDLKGGTTGQVLSKASNTDMDFTWVAQDDSNAIQNAIVDAKGDLITATAADTPARLAVGANGKVLKANSSTATGLEWGDAGGGASTWTLLNSGGTALTGAQTITVSGISGVDKIMIFIQQAGSVNASAEIGFRLNGDTGSNYYPFGGYNRSNASGLVQILEYQQAQTYIAVGRMEDDAAGRVTGSVFLQNATATSGVKMFNFMGAGSNVAGGENQRNYFGWGYYDSTSTISSISIFSNTGNFDGGTVYVYTSAS